MESINAVDDVTSQRQQQPGFPVTTEEKSAAALMSKKAMRKAIPEAPTDMILPDDDGAIHSRHTFSSRKKMHDAAARRRNMSGSQNNQQQRSKNFNSGGILISPLPDGTNNARQGEPPRKPSNKDSGSSDMKWSTIGKTKLSGTQELDKLASLIPQPVSPECSVEEIDQGEKMMMAAVSPEASSPVTATYQKKQYSNFKTPRKFTTPTNHQNSNEEPSSAEETPITELFNYYNFPNHNTSSSKTNSISNLSPAAPNLLETSPFRISSKLLDDQLQSVLDADLSMDRKIEQMEKDLDDNDSYMGSPMSGSPNGRYRRADSSDDDDTNDESKDTIRSDNRDESFIGTISEVISEISVGAETAYFQNLQSPDTNSNEDFLTPKSCLVVKGGQRTAGTAYYTAMNGREGDEESRMYDSDSETYSVRRMHVQQRQQHNLRPRTASYDAVSGLATVDRDVSTNTDAVQQQVRRHSMSPPAELRTTRVLWNDDTTPMRVASLHWEFEAEEKSPNKRALSGGTKQKRKPQTPFSNAVKQKYDATASATLASLTPTQPQDRASSKKTGTLPNASPLQLERISEEQLAESVQSDSQAQSERTELLNVIKVMRIQLTHLEDERDSLIAERTEDCNEKEALSAQIKTLEEEVQISLQVVENVKETMASKTDETDCLKQLLLKSEENLGSLRTTLLSKNDEVEELSMALKEKEGVLEARLQSTEAERLSEVDRVTSEMQQVHIEAIAKLESELKEAHGNEMDHVKAALANDYKEKSDELVKKHALLVEQLQASSSEEIARARCEAEKEHLAVVEAMALSHTQEIASTVERLNASRSQAIEGLTAAHYEEVKLLQDGSQELKESAERLSNEKDDFIRQISLLEETNEGLAERLSNLEKEHHLSLEAARHREKLSTDSYTEAEATLKETNVNLALVRKENQALQETVTNLTKSLEAKDADFEGAVHEKDTIQSDMKRQLLDSQAEIDSMALAKAEVESKYAALLQENCSLKESNSTLNEANSTLQASLGEVSDKFSVVTQEKEELVTSLEDATSSVKTLEDRIASADSELEMQKRRSAELSRENEEASQNLQLQVESAIQEKDEMATELDALTCLEKEIREQLDASDEDRKYLQEVIAELRDQLLGANKERDHICRELQGMASLREEMSLDNQSNVTRISELQSEVRELQSEVRALSRVKNILQLKSDKFESMNASAVAELEERNKEIARLRGENDEAISELVQLKSKLQCEIEKTANLDAEKLKVEVQLKCTESEREQLLASDEERESLREEIVELRFELLGANEHRDHLSRELQGMASLREEMSRDNQSNVTRISELQSEVRELSRVKNILQLKSDKFESMNTSTATELDERNKEIARLRGENDEAISELVQLKSKLQCEIEKTANLDAEKSKVEVQLKCTESGREDMQRKLDEAMISCETMLLSLEDARLQIQLKSDEIESLNASTTAKLNGVSETMEVLSQENVAAKADLEKVQSQLQSESAKMADVLSENSSMEMLLDSVQQERDGLQHKLDEVFLSLEDARSQIHTKSNEIESLIASSAAEVGDVKTKFDMLREENVATNAAMELLQSEKSSLEMQLSSTQEERDDLQQRFDETIVTLEDARGQIQVKSNEIELLTISNASLREEVSKKLDALQKEKSGVELQLKSTKKDSNDLQEKFDEAAQCCESMALLLENARSQIQTQSRDLESLNVSAKAEREEVKKMVVALQEVISNVELQLVSVQQERDGLQEKFDEALVSCESMLLSLGDARSQIHTQSDEIELLNTCAASKDVEAKKNLGMLREENIAIKAEMELLQSEKSSLVEQVNAIKDERAGLQQRFDEALVSCESMLLSLEDARRQIQLQSSEIELLNTKSGVELQLKSTQPGHDELREKFDEAAVSCESMLLSLEDAPSQDEVDTIQVQVREAGWANNADAFTRLQACAAKLAVNVLQLKFKFKTEVERNDELTIEIKSKNEQVTSLETCLDELRNDHTVEQNLKSTVAKLALALVKLKARERRALAVQQKLEASNIELLAKVEYLSKANEGMEEGMAVLTDKISALELDSSSNQSSIAVLQKTVSEKDAEVKRLGDLLSGKDEAITDLMNEMQKIRSDVVNGVRKLELEHASAMKARATLEEELENVNAQLNRESELVFILQSQLEQTISEKNIIEDDMVDLQGTNVHLENHLEQMKNRANLEEGLGSGNLQLNRESELVFYLQSQLEQTISEKNAIEDDMVDLQGANVHLENHLEQVTQDRSHLRTQIEDLHDSMAALEAEKDSLAKKLGEYEEQAEYFTTKIAALEKGEKSNARQIDYMEFQLVAKMDEAEALNEMVVSHEATMKELNDEIEAMDAKRIETEESLSSLHSKMDTVVNERDDLASQLQSAIEELQSVREEWEKVRSNAGSSPVSTPTRADTSQEVDDLASSPGQGIRKILESSKLSREDIDFICSSMDKSKTILTQVGEERRSLKKEVKRLLAELEHAQGELTTVKKNCKVMNQQTIALRGDINEARSLLKECEAEKNQLTSELDAAHEAMDEIQRCSSESQNALVKKSRDEISTLKSEMESKDEAIARFQSLRENHISKFDVTTDSIDLSQQPTVVTSTTRFKVEKGQSMFGILKGKRSKRKGKDQLSYRKRK